eukprot:5447338-Lingulodinium_polyedra.AAC.1
MQPVALPRALRHFPHPLAVHPPTTALQELAQHNPTVVTGLETLRHLGKNVEDAPRMETPAWPFAAL